MIKKLNLKKILVILFIIKSLKVKAEFGRFGLEGGIISGGLSGNTVGFFSGNSINYNLSIWMEHWIIHREENSSQIALGYQVKLNYNSYSLSAVSISETTVPLLFKICPLGQTSWSDGIEYRVDFFVGPQIGFYNISGGTFDQSSGKDYSILLGGSICMSKSSLISLSLYKQIGLTKFTSSQTTSTLSGLTLSLGFSFN